MRYFLLALLVSATLTLPACRSSGVHRGKRLPKSGPIPCPIKDC